MILITCKNGKQIIFSCFLLLLAAALVLTVGCAGEVSPEQETAVGGSILLATTTSTYDSGLLDYIIPVFTENTGIEVRVLSRGTGQALELGQRGDADVLLVHDRAAELQLVADGFFTDRYDVMYNDFVIVGPPEDPAGVKGEESVVKALDRIAAGEQPFISRGDDSGTNRMELRLWGEAAIDPAGTGWYFAVGQGMGDTLRVAGEKMGYTITDRATFVSLQKNLDLEIVLEGDPALFNQYGVMAVSREKHPHVRYERALKFIEFLMSDQGQALISSFQIDGETLFWPGLGI
ncbi:MAG: substrate-binding domain-containing protein [Bacillota bacterium]